MSWFNKKENKSGLPDLPPLTDSTFNDLPTLPHEMDKEFSPLPAFVPLNSSKTNSFTVKDVISTTPIPETKQMTREIDEYEIKPEKTYKKTNEPIYVRIDKYQESHANFLEIKKKILEIQNVLTDIKELKAKEESELAEWEKEIQETKDKLASIDETIFQKLA